MHRPLRRLFIVGAFLAATLCAQDIAGTWQGTLSPPNMNRDLRVVMKISKGDGAAWNGLPGIGFGRLGQMNATHANMSDLAGVFQAAVLDRPVVDQTGNSGRFDFQLKWTPDETQFTGLEIKAPPPSDSADAPPDLFTPLQEQLGLKLTATKAPVDVLVIDRAEKPSGN